MTNDTEIGVYTDLLQPGADCIRVGTLWIHHRRQDSAICMKSATMSDS